MSQEKKPYCRIDFKHCSIEFDFTVCPFDDVLEYVSSLRDDFELLNGEECPEIKITVVWMYESEYNNWFDKNVNP